MRSSGAANTGGGSSNPDPLKNKDGSVYKEEFGRVHAQGVNMIQRASQLHDASYHRQGKTKATASCQRVALSEDGEKLRAQNRSILLLVQTMTASKSNLCEGQSRGLARRHGAMFAPTDRFEGHRAQRRRHVR